MAKQSRLEKLGMTSDEDLLEDEDEILVYVELEGTVASNTFTTEQLQLDMIGIDTEHPIMQINGRFYEGTYEDAVGTYMFFRKDETAVPDNPVFDMAPTLKYFAKTRKLLKMQRIFIKHRTEVLGDSDDPRCIPNLNTIAEAGVPLKHQEEALLFWQTIRDGRINALTSYLEKQRIREEKKKMGIAVDSESDEDSPFAAYKQNAKANVRGENQNTDSKKDGVEMSEYTKERKEDAEKNDRTGSTVADELSGLEKLALQETNSDSLISKESEPQKISTDQQKPKVSGGRKKKVVIIHDPKRKRCKRKQVPVKEKTSAEIEPTKEEKEAKKDEAESTNVKTLQEPEIPERSNTCVRQFGEDEMDTTVPEEVLKETAKIDNEETANMKTPTKKRLKREAKMKAIAERLKTIAGGCATAKSN